jgi:hypothetical protein
VYGKEGNLFLCLVGKRAGKQNISGAGARKGVRTFCEIPFLYEAPIISTEWGGRPAQSSITHIRLPMPLTDQ